MPRTKIEVTIRVRESASYGDGQVVAESTVVRDVVEDERLESEVGGGD